MGQRSGNAALKGVQIVSSKEGYALGTGRRKKNAAVKDVQIMPRKEEYARGMGQRSKYATVKDVKTKLSKEGCVLGTVLIVMHSSNSNHKPPSSSF